MLRNYVLSLCSLAVAAGAVALSGCGSNAVPENPGWAHDIQPLMEAHCTRCHGAGGMLNGDPDVPPNAKDACLVPTDGGAYTCKPLNGNFTTQAGLMTYVGSNGGVLLKAYLAYPMPPPPSEPLDDYEYNLLMTWAQEAHPLP